MATNVTGSAAVNQAIDRPMASVLRVADQARKPRDRSWSTPTRQKYRIGATNNTTLAARSHAIAALPSSDASRNMTGSLPALNATALPSSPDQTMA